MHKSFLLKTIFFVFVFLGVLAVIISMMNGTVEEAGQTHTFFGQFIIAGGPIVWFVLLPLSLITAYLAAEHSLTIRRKKLLPGGIGGSIVEIIQRFGPEHLEAKLAGRGDFVSVAVVQAVSKGKGDWFRMRNTLGESLQDQALGLLRKIEWVNLIGNVSPMIGLFGTVFGMIKLFNAIVIAGGQPQPAQLAGGISIALVTTFWGLFIAIPASIIHGVFRNRIETLISDAVAETDNIMSQIKLSLSEQKPQSAKTEDKPSEFISQPI